MKRKRNDLQNEKKFYTSVVVCVEDRETEEGSIMI